MVSTTLAIYDGTMVYIRGESGVLGIATDKFASGKHLNEKGEEIRGLTAGLWLVIRGRPGTNVIERANAGRKVDYPPFRIKVSAIGSDRRGMYVRVDVSEPGGGTNASEKKN